MQRQGPEPSDGQLHLGASESGSHQGVRCQAVGQPGGLCDGGKGWEYDGGVQGWDKGIGGGASHGLCGCNCSLVFIGE